MQITCHWRIQLTEWSKGQLTTKQDQEDRSSHLVLHYIVSVRPRDRGPSKYSRPIMVNDSAVGSYMLTRPTFLPLKLIAWVWKPRSMITATETCESVLLLWEKRIDVTLECNRVAWIGHCDYKLLTIIDCRRQPRITRPWHCEIWRLEIFDSIFSRKPLRRNTGVGIASGTANASNADKWNISD